MRVLFAGTPHAAVPSLQALLASDHDVTCVLTRPDAPSGRGRRLRPSPVAELAEGAGVEVWRASSLRDPDSLPRLQGVGADVAAIVAYGALVPPQLLGVPQLGWVNLHFSLLPAWRGAAPVQHALLAGDAVTGATTFRLDEGLDTGPVLGVLTEAVRPDDTAGTLLERLSVSGAGLLVATLDALAAGDLVAVEQGTDGVSFAPKLTSADARLRWSEPALAVQRLVRACTPAPGAWTTVGDSRLKVLVVDLEPQAEPLAPGEVVVGADSVLVGTGSHPVRLAQVQPSGRQPMPASAWARGARLPAGTVLT